MNILTMLEAMKTHNEYKYKFFIATLNFELKKTYAIAEYKNILFLYPVQ